MDFAFMLPMPFMVNIAFATDSSYLLSFFADDDTRRDVTVGNYSIDAAGNDIAVPYGALNLGKWRCNWKAGPRTATLKRMSIGLYFVIRMYC